MKELKPDEWNDLLFCAFRYALGRKTYIVSTVTQLLIEHKNRLDDHHRNLILKEIKNAKNKDQLGHECDYNDWVKVEQELCAMDVEYYKID